MSLFIIPTTDEPYYDETVSMLERPYVLRFRYNHREECWYVSLLNIAKQPLVEGIKLVPGVDLLERYRYNPEVPQVVLSALVNGTSDGPPTLEELGEGLRVELVYATP